MLLIALLGALGVMFLLGILSLFGVFFVTPEDL